MQEVKAQFKNAKSSAQKVRIVVDKIRGLPVEGALNILTFSTKKAAQLVQKVLMSAIANAENNNGLDIDTLKISKAFVDEGSTAKRWRARAKGRGARILKRTCHITVIVSGEE